MDSAQEALPLLIWSVRQIAGGAVNKPDEPIYAQLNASDLWHRFAKRLGRVSLLSEPRINQGVTLYTHVKAQIRQDIASVQL